MADRVPTNNSRRVSGGTPRTSARNTPRTSAVFDAAGPMPHGQGAGAFTSDPSSSSSMLYYPSQRFNPSLRSFGSRGSLSEQFAMTRREYEFGFDDAMSFVAPSEQYEYGDSDEDEDEDVRTEDGEGVVVVPPGSDEEGGGRGKRKERKRRGVERVRRSHYELLCLSPEEEEGEGAPSEGEIRRAYFRLYDILRSPQLPPGYRETAEAYFGDVQVAFETLIGKGRDREAYDAVAAEERQVGGASSEDEAEEDGKGASAFRRASRRFAARLRRQQEQEVTEVGLQLDAQPLFSATQSPSRRRRGLPAALSLSHSKTVSLPSVSQFLEPQARRLNEALNRPVTTTTTVTTPTTPTPRQAGKGNADLNLYFPPPTLTISISLFAPHIRTTHLLPSSALSQRNPTFIPEDVPRDRPLAWYTTLAAPHLNLRLRQALFFSHSSSPSPSLRAATTHTPQALPDAVVELEADALGAITTRASTSLSTSAFTSRALGDEPVHAEASVSVGVAAAGGGHRAARLGLAVHRRVRGGTVFACADGGTSSSPLLPMRGASWGDDGADAGASWRSYMDRLARGLVESRYGFYSPPTMEVGYRFGAGGGVGKEEGELLGLRAGRAFTRQARSGLRRLHDEVDLLEDDKGRNGGSWTVSGAVTPSGVAGYLRYGKDLFFSFPHASEEGQGQTQNPSRPQKSWTERLGFRLEAELTAQKTKNLAPWGRSETSHLAVRALKKIGRASRVGLELGVSGASNSAVLSLYFSRRTSGSDSSKTGAHRRLVVPVLLLRDNPGSSTTTTSSHYSTFFLCCTALLPALCLAALDRALAPPHPENKSDKHTTTTSPSHHARQAARRAEADALVALLANPVLHRQRLRRERGGLAILSAKFGALEDPASAASPAPRWTALDEVADVTVAVAALVDEDEAGGGSGMGSLRIPRGLRKSRVLGFWDPRPGRTKWLVVRYVYGGREGVRAVEGREELRLP